MLEEFLITEAEVSMSWSSLVIVIVGALVAAALLIALIENWARAEPVLSRWTWLVEAALGLMVAGSAMAAWYSGDRGWALIGTALASMFLLSSVTSFRRARRAPSLAQENSSRQP